ncbi:ATP-binding protein [Methylomonas sp. MgM2]
MQLQSYLLTRIILVVLLCLGMIGSYALDQSHRQAVQVSRQLAESLARHLESQLLLTQAGIGRANPFPDFDSWKQHASIQPGTCVVYTPVSQVTPRSLCNGDKSLSKDWPNAFAAVYRLLLEPGLPVEQTVAPNGRHYGRVTVSPSAEQEIAQAWRYSRSLMSLSGATVLAVSVLVYLVMRRALRPSLIIVDGLKKLEGGLLSFRLPAFELNEWQSIASAINQLAASQQQLLSERQRLIGKMLELQEQERRELAGELHDEFGQCLAAINAVAASIKQTAAEKCPGLLEDGERIGRITGHMQLAIRAMLQRLHPPEWHELGLAASLSGLVASWNGHAGAKTRYALTVSGNVQEIQETPALFIFRAVQECLTNVAKHAEATQVDIRLTVTSDRILVEVTDDGKAAALPFAGSAGIGLLGMRERAEALGGRAALSIQQPHGLRVSLTLPVHKRS